MNQVRIKDIRGEGWDLLGTKSRKLRIALGKKIFLQAWRKINHPILSKIVPKFGVTHHYGRGPALNFKIVGTRAGEQIFAFDFMLTSPGEIRAGDFQVNPKLQGQGIASALFRLRDRVAKQFSQTRQIIMALDAGRVVWAKKQYGTKFYNYDEILEYWEEWNKARGNKVPNLGNVPHKYPKEFLLSMDWINYVREPI